MRQCQQWDLPESAKPEPAWSGAAKPEPAWSGATDDVHVNDVGVLDAHELLPLFVRNGRHVRLRCKRRNQVLAVL